MGALYNYDLVGVKYGRLTITCNPYRATKKDGKQAATFVLAVCDCGNIGEYYLRYLKIGKTISCGCFRKECTIERSKTHGFTKIGTIEFDIYRVWQGMKSRCYDKNQPCYKHYGGRGIKVCSEWINDPVAFYNWAIDNGYRRGLFLDKVSNYKHYSPDNCRFVSPKESTLNRRFVKLNMGIANEIRQLYASNKMTYVVVSKRFNVTPETISHVVRNKTWI